VEGPSVLLLAGPTASGKSAWALRWAERTGAAVVNADSQQLYRDLRVLSARPDAEEEARAPHHLYGVADAAEAWSVGRWLRAVLPVLEQLRAADRPAVLVGGTGLYFRALTHGLAEIPPVAPEARDAATAELDRLGEARFRRALADHDPEAARRIAPGDRQRLIRAWSVREGSGRSLSDWQADTRPALAPGDYRTLRLDPPRAELYARCDARAAAMISGGALDEVAALVARGLPPELPAMKAVGVRPLAAYLAGALPLEAASAQVQGDTRRYAKRQRTWFRNQTPDWPSFDPFSPNSAAPPEFAA
jgi:tRNA dimethylallyltransferase